MDSEPAEGRNLRQRDALAAPCARLGKSSAALRRDLDRLFRAAEKSGALREKWLAFASAASDAREEFPEAIASFDVSNEIRWLEHSDHSIFFPEVWQREQHRGKQADKSQLYHSPEARERLARAEAALRALLKQAQAKPSSYYAVLALDGDQIGKWLGGEKSPAVERVISSKATQYFRQKMLAEMTSPERAAFGERLQKGEIKLEKPTDWSGAWPPEQPKDWIKAWLASSRPISPSWHLQFSEALANFGLHATRRIVEDVHHGQLIYAGGDDVLAMLPADEAITCTRDLRAAFQGRHGDMSPDCQARFRADAPEGFLWLAKPKQGAPTWPLLVPGPRMTVSVGIAIGHVKEPLQDLIAEAQRAEKRAKAAPEQFVLDRSAPDPSKHIERWKAHEGWDRDALAVTLFKRSGETIRWGAKFGSPAFPLLEYVQAHYRAPWNEPQKKTAITGRFPYRLAELLDRYGRDAESSKLREIAFTISRQTLKDAEAAEHSPDFNRTQLETLCGDYLDHLADFEWTRPSA